MATIETRRLQDGTTTFRAKVRLKGYSPEHATFTRKTDAVRWSQSTEAAMREGRYFRTTEAKRRTVAQLLDRYVEEVVPMRPRNACNTRRHVAYWRQMIGQLALADATPSVIVEQRNGLLKGITRRGTPRSHATVVRYLATLSHVFNIALKDWQWASDNPVAKITKPREARGRERFLSDAERLRLLETCQASSSRHLYTVVVLAISTGMRRGEIMNIRWHDVDLKRQAITLRQTKNDTSRSVPLTGLAHQLIAAMVAQDQKAADLLFAREDGRAPVELSKAWNTALERADIVDFRFHDLRHTAASYLAMNGATTMEIATVLGHKTLQMVKRYSHLAHSHTAGVVTAMNDKVFGSQEQRDAARQVVATHDR